MDGARAPSGLFDFFMPSFAYNPVILVANILQDEAAALHRHGCCLLPFADPTYELKGAKAFIHEDRQLFFKNRIEAICDTFKVSHDFTSMRQNAV